MTKANIQVERTLLQFLCGGKSRKQAREEVLAKLKSYRFGRVEHQVLFDCLQAMPLDRPELLRELLPARLVRTGFPDFDLAPFVDAGEPGELSEEEARTLCRELLQGE